MYIWLQQYTSIEDAFSYEYEMRHYTSISIGLRLNIVCEYVNTYLKGER